MLHPRWNDEIRIRAATRPEGKLTDEDWLYVLEQGILEDEVDRVSSTEKLEVFLKEVRRLRRDGELPRTRRRMSDSYPQRHVRGWITDDESTMAAAVSDAMYRRALANEEVQRVRALAVEQLPQITESEIRDAWAEGGGFLAPGFVRFAIKIADYFGWDAEDAAVFLLTGSTPLVEPLRASISIREFRDEHGAPTPRARARIVLEFDPWLSKETVARAYENLRRELLGKGSKRPEFPELEVFRFVVAHLESDGSPTESWSAIGRAWNEKHAGTAWTYSKPEDIKRAYLSVRRRIINGQYHLSGTELVSAPAPGGNDRGSYIRMFVDPRERGPGESDVARPTLGD